MPLVTGPCKGCTLFLRDMMIGVIYGNDVRLRDDCRAQQTGAPPSTREIQISHPCASDLPDQLGTISGNVVVPLLLASRAWSQLSTRCLRGSREVAQWQRLKIPWFLPPPLPLRLVPHLLTVQAFHPHQAGHLRPKTARQKSRHSLIGLSLVLCGGGPYNYL